MTTGRTNKLKGAEWMAYAKGGCKEYPFNHYRGIAALKVFRKQEKTRLRMEAKGSTALKGSLILVFTRHPVLRDFYQSRFKKTAP